MALAYTVRVEPKVWFSTERTFMHWAKVSVMLASFALALMFNPGGAYGALAVGVSAALVLAYALYRYQARAGTLEAGGKGARLQDFGDRAGALLLAGAITVALLVLVHTTAAQFRQLGD